MGVVVGCFLVDCCVSLMFAFGGCFWGVVVVCFLPAFLWVLAGFGLSFWLMHICGFFLGLFCVFLLESLILAQDERWRRA